MKHASFVAAAFTIFLASCAPAPIVLRHEPAGAAAAPVAGRPVVFVLEVENSAGVPRIYGAGGGGKRAKLSDDSLEGVRAGLNREIEHAGFKVTTTPTDADASLKAEITMMDAGWDVGGDIPVVGRIILAARLISSAGKVLWKDKLTGRGQAIIVGANVPGQGPSNALNGALSDAAAKLGVSLAAAFSPEPKPAPRAAPAQAEVRETAAPAAVAAGSDLDDLPAARAVSKRRHAVVIGVERYRENLPRADFAAGDAKLAAEYFKRVLGVPEENLALLVDERAAKSDFEKYFERWLPNRVEAGDEVFIYFSGHGSPNPAKGDAYLVPYDGDPTYIAQTGYPLKRLYEQLSKLPAKSVIVAMDSCFSGAGGRSVLAKGARPLVSVVVAEAIPAKLTVLAASAGDQISNSYQEKGHGLFTYFLLKGMKEKGSDMKGVFEYLKPEVARTARRELNSDQDPQWREGK